MYPLNYIHFLPHFSALKLKIICFKGCMKGEKKILDKN